MINLNKLIQLVQTVFPAAEVILIEDHYDWCLYGGSPTIFELIVGFDHVRCVWNEGVPTEDLARQLCSFMCQFKLGHVK